MPIQARKCQIINRKDSILIETFKTLTSSRPHTPKRKREKKTEIQVYDISIKIETQTQNEDSAFKPGC